MSEQIKVGRLARDFQAVDVSITRAADEPVRLSFPASSEMPVERYFGTEILRHDAKSIRMDRLNGGAAPLLFNHNWDDPIGMVDRAAIKDGRLWVDAHLFDTDRAREVAAMVSGGMRNVSIGYELHEMTEDAKRGTFTATDWSVLEVSFATVPADPSVGVGREASNDAKPVRLLRAAEVSNPAAVAAASPKESTVDQSTNAAAGANAASQQDPAQARSAAPTGNAMQMEESRRRGIDNLCRANKIDDNIRNFWVTGGASMEHVSQELLQILEQRGAPNANQSVAKLGLGEGETKRYSLMNAIRAVADQNWTNAGFEAECSREIAKRLNTVSDPNKFYVPFEVQGRGVNAANGSLMTDAFRRTQRRDLTAGTASAGGFMVGTENMSFIEILRNRSIAYRLGARRMSGLVGNVTVPRQTGAATAVWLATEATAITESQQTLGQLALTPKTVGAYTEISRQLMLQSSPDAEAMVTSDLGAVAALAIDVGAIRGSGASGEPTGIVNTAGIGSVAGAGFIAAAFARVLEFQTDVATANIYPAAGGYVTTPSVAASMIQAVKYASTASPIWEGNVWDGTMQGFPAMATNQMTAASMIYGDWSQLVVAEWGVLQVEVNPYANFQAGIVGVRALVSVDVALRYAGAFSLATSIA
jgi:HK97 family phage major capsid protein/HK97 family phage prohead protease